MLNIRAHSSAQLYFITKLDEVYLLSVPKLYRLCIYCSFHHHNKKRKLFLFYRLILSLMGVLSEIQSGDELTLLVNSGICAHIEFILKEAGNFNEYFFFCVNMKK